MLPDMYEYNDSDSGVDSDKWRQLALIILRFHKYKDVWKEKKKIKPYDSQKKLLFLDNFVKHIERKVTRSKSCGSSKEAAGPSVTNFQSRF